jgi:threonine/homoserine/homoserine lactone efflux protein
LPEHLLPFLGVVVVITLLPGPDMALAVRNGVRGGRRAAWLTGAGCLLGLLVWAATSVLGLAAVLAASGRAFAVIRIAGAAYLAVLGLGALRSALGGGETSGGRMRLAAARTVGPVTGSLDSDGVWFRQGLISNLLNPKIALLFITLLPQFVGAHEPRTATTAELALTMLIVAALWWALFGAAVGAIAEALTRAPVRRGIEGIAGVLLLALALRVVLSS